MHHNIYIYIYIEYHPILNLVSLLSYIDVSIKNLFDKCSKIVVLYLADLYAYVILVGWFKLN